MQQLPAAGLPQLPLHALQVKTAALAQRSSHRLSQQNTSAVQTDSQQVASLQYGVARLVQHDPAFGAPQPGNGADRFQRMTFDTPVDA